MKKFKERMLKIIKPKLFLLIFFDILGFSMVTVTLIKGYNDSAFGYISYVFSAYCLVITVMKVPKIYTIVYNKLDNIQLTNRLIHDDEFRTRVGLYIGIIINIAYAVFKIVTGFMYKSIWFESVAIYYIILCATKYVLIRKFKDKNTNKLDYKQELKSYGFTGILILILNLAIAIMMFEVIWHNNTYTYAGVIIYAAALYTFYNIITAIINMVKFHDLKSPVLTAVKYLGFITAIMSLFSLQTALISKFGNDENFRQVMNTLTGIAVILTGIVISIRMIIKSKKDIENITITEE